MVLILRAKWFATTTALCLASCGGSGGALQDDAGIAMVADGAVGGEPVPDAGAPADAASPPPPGAQDFATRCAQPGVVRCVGFDTDGDFVHNGDIAGIIPNGESDYSVITRDTSVRASGSGALRFTIPAKSGANSSGAYYTNFSDDLSVQFDGGQEFYVQWRQRFSQAFITTPYAGGGGAKQTIIGTGDQPGTPFKYYSSCSDLEIETGNYQQRGFPIMYNSCSGSDSHGPYDGFYEPFGASDFKLENGRAAPYCLYSQSGSSYFAPTGNCFGYAPDEWMTFQAHVQLGTRVGNEFKGSHVRLWVAHEGKASELVIDWGPYNLTAGNPTDNQRFGKVWLLPYNTGKDPSVSYPTAYTWYDELIVSRSLIADPS